MSAALEIRNLSYRYPGGRGITDVSFDAGEGEVVCLFGWNGAGKTTLFKVLSTLLSPQAGSCRVCGHDVARDRNSARRNLFPVFDANAHFSHLTGRENARFFLSLYGIPEPGPLDRIAGDFDLDLDRPAGEYSLGMKRRLLLAEAFAAARKVLVFDEPALGLDTVIRPVFFERARGAAEAGSCVLIGTNRIEDAASADRILLLDRGTLCPAASVKALAERMVKVTISLEDRELVEYIPSVDELPQLVKKVLTIGIPRRIDIGDTGGEEPGLWTREAEDKVRRAPPVLQAMIRSLVERYAREHGCRRITPELVDEVRGKFGQR
jgi:ABC-type multidrug transport system ATPase subunit